MRRIDRGRQPAAGDRGPNLGLEVTGSQPLSDVGSGPAKAVSGPNVIYRGRR
jgi:hypothetical protein